LRRGSKVKFDAVATAVKISHKSSQLTADRWPESLTEALSHAVDCYAAAGFCQQNFVAHSGGPVLSLNCPLSTKSPPKDVLILAIITPPAVPHTNLR
jgi:hypothetical protein